MQRSAARCGHTGRSSTGRTNAWLSRVSFASVATMPLLFADPADLHRAAHRIREHAADLRRRAALLTGSAERAQWRSPAAAAFRGHVGQMSGRMCSAAHQLERTAETLDRHARAVSHTIHSVEHAAVRAVQAVI